MVAKLCRGKQEASLQHADAGAGWNGVKVLDAQLCDSVPRVLQGDLVKIAVLTLQLHQIILITLLSQPLDKSNNSTSPAAAQLLKVRAVVYSRGGSRQEMQTPPTCSRKKKRDFCLCMA